MKTILATGTDRKYLPRVWPYLESIQEKSFADRNVVFVPVVGDQTWFHAVRTLPSVAWVPVPIERLRAGNPNNCLQHGEFLDFDVEEGSDDDLIVFTDGDIVLQRWFTPEELGEFESLGSNDVAVAYNEGPWGTLERELRLLQPKVDVEEIWRTFPGAQDGMICFNTGVVIAKRSAYRRLCEHYVDRFSEVDRTLGHYAKQQWLLSYLLQSEGFQVKVLRGEIHTHGCHPLPLEASRVGDELFFRGERVMFRHNIEFGPPIEFTGSFVSRFFGQQPTAPGAALQPVGRAPDRVAEGPRASVIVHSHNAAASLAEFLKATLPTLGREDELLIADDASTDQTSAFLDQIEGREPRLKRVALPVRSGVAAAWNAAARSAQGRILVFSRVEARPTPDWLDHICAHFSTPKVAAVGPLIERGDAAQSFNEFLPMGLEGQFSWEQLGRLIGQLNLGRSFEAKRLDPILLALNRASFDLLKGFDSALDGGFEVHDIVWRIRNAGLVARVACDALVRGSPELPLSTGAWAEALAGKLEAHYGPLGVPLPVEIWGADVFGPDWSPRVAAPAAA